MGDAKVADLKAKAAASQARAKSATEKAAALKTGASNAAQDAAKAALKAKAEAAKAKEVEAENEAKVKVAEHKAADAQAAADEAQEEATKAQTLADGIHKKLHDAKCANNGGCSGLQGYCCPTFDPTHYTLGEAPTWGINLGCCGGSTEELATADVDTTGYDGLTMVFSMAVSAAIGGAVASKFRSRGDDSARYTQ